MGAVSITTDTTIVIPMVLRAIGYSTMLFFISIRKHELFLIIIIRAVSSQMFTIEISAVITIIPSLSLVVISSFIEGHIYLQKVLIIISLLKY